MALMDHGSITDKNFRLGSGLQFAANGIDGITLSGRADISVTKFAAVRASVGFGTVNHFGLAFKWTPIPDFEDQPSFGGILMSQYGMIDSVSEVSFRFAPFLSKKFEVEPGMWTLYTALPFGHISRKEESRKVFQWVIGSDFAMSTHPHVHYLFEFGFNLDKAFNYFDVGVTCDLE